MQSREPERKEDVKPAPALTEAERIRWYAPPGHSGQAVLQVKVGDEWRDVPTVTVP